MSFDVRRAARATVSLGVVLVVFPATLCAQAAKS